ncbi:nickel-responsive transcriptional regulator NikR [Candidatus Woesearchaeota archaeon]|nr:nickel-responsive transcriptional regulator NikR [Candidatus Woesearchaeota archaeon]
MDRIIRKGIAFEPEILEKFDEQSTSKGYKNRSEAIRDLIRKSLIKEKSEDMESEMIGTLTLVYNHHDHDIQHDLTHLQHDNHGIIISTMHTHMNADDCLEVVVFRGKVKDIKKTADGMIARKGVKFGKLVLAQ